MPLGRAWVNAVLIDGPSGLVQEIPIARSHIAIEEEIGTRFWVSEKLPHRNGDKLYCHETYAPNKPTYRFMGRLYCGSGLIVGVDSLGDLRDANTPVEQVKKLVEFIGHDAAHEAAEGGV